MEYADSGTLRKYLRERFENLAWSHKLNLALQLTHAVSCLHDEDIVHRDLVGYLFIYSKLNYYISNIIFVFNNSTLIMY